MSLNERVNLLRTAGFNKDTERFQHIMAGVLPGFKQTKPSPALETALKLLARRRVPAALKRFSAVLRKSPLEPRALSGRALCWWERGDYGRALKDMDRAVKADGENESLLVLRAQLKEEIHMLHEEIPEPSERRADYGIDEPERDFASESLSDLTRALALKPTSQIYAHRALAYIFQEKYEEALADCERSLALGHKGADVHCHRAMALYNLERDEEAVPEAKEAIRLDGKDQWPHLVLGWMAAEAEEYKAALGHFRAALALDKRNPHTLASMGRCYIKLAKFPEAAEYINKALKYDPEDPYPHYVMSLWMEAQGGESQALWTLLNAATACRPDGRILRRIGELIEKRVMPMRPD